jgi:hypothetical protein
MKDEPVRQPRARQRGRAYIPEVEDALRVIAETQDYICAERLTPSLVPTPKALIAHGKLAVSKAAAGTGSRTTTAPSSSRRG